jgi:hypothetical protein
VGELRSELFGRDLLILMSGDAASFGGDAMSRFDSLARPRRAVIAGRDGQSGFEEIRDITYMYDAFEGWVQNDYRSQTRLVPALSAQSPPKAVSPSWKPRWVYGRQEKCCVRNSPTWNARRCVGFHEPDSYSGSGRAGAKTWPSGEPSVYPNS